MKALFLSAACIALAGCAGSAVAPPEQRLQAAASPASDPAVSPAAAPEGDNESAEYSMVVEATAGASEDEIVCQRETPFGTRIARQRCRLSGEGTQAALERDRLRSEMAYAREIALIEEGRRMAEQEAGASRGAATSGTQ